MTQVLRTLQQAKLPGGIDLTQRESPPALWKCVQVPGCFASHFHDPTTPCEKMPILILIRWAVDTVRCLENHLLPQSCLSPGY